MEPPKVQMSLEDEDGNDVRPDDVALDDAEVSLLFISPSPGPEGPPQPTVVAVIWEEVFHVLGETMIDSEARCNLQLRLPLAEMVAEICEDLNGLPKALGSVRRFHLESWSRAFEEAAAHLRALLGEKQ